ncbi:Tad domain-containing protein [Isoptericola sp. NPDC019482]|uniref:TadE/TadG family type IV pilus assembly protein n=1 Tax=Isoptericola sp. NPDC019482 TaxID=3154688 RepID=UPI003474327E
MRRTRQEAERGSVSIWLALGAFVMIVVVGMAVDLSGQVLAQQHARDVAQQAARVGAQQVVASEALSGRGISLDAARARQAAGGFVGQAGLTLGRPVVVAGDRVEVTTRDSYTPKFLGIIGIRSMPVSGEGEARAIRTLVVGGEPVER